MTRLVAIAMTCSLLGAGAGAGCDLSSDDPDDDFGREELALGGGGELAPPCTLQAHTNPDKHIQVNGDGLAFVSNGIPGSGYLWTVSPASCATITSDPSLPQISYHADVAGCGLTFSVTEFPPTPPGGCTATRRQFVDFTDVPAASPTYGYHDFIDNIAGNGVTGGCAAGMYCPTSPVTRDQMPVFVLRSFEGPSYVPPACSGPPIFADVPTTSPFCPWIEELARRAVVVGCGGGNYCPTNPVTREQMSVFLLRTRDPGGPPPACVAGSEMFSDVPASNPFCRWIEQLAREGITSGCGPGVYCPTANTLREQMAVFLVRTFGLIYP